MEPSKKATPYGLTPGDQPGGGSKPGEISPRFDVLQRQGVEVVTLLSRDVVDAHEIETLGAELQKHLAKDRPTKVVLDLNAVQHLSSAALSMLLVLKSSVEANGGALRLTNVHQDLQQIFKMTKLHKVLMIKKSVDAAIASF